jgi:hypothetical protein
MLINEGRELHRQIPGSPWIRELVGTQIDLNNDTGSAIIYQMMNLNGQKEF